MTKVASARFILALAIAAALAVSGCGGDSDESESTSESRASTTNAEGGSSSARGKSSSSDENGDSAGSTNGGSPGGKQGPKVAVPEGEPEPGFTPEQRAEATVVDLSLSSPSLPSASGGAPTLPTTYTCDGKDTWPTLRWQGIPPGTQELAVLVAGFQPVNEELAFSWAVAGLDPELDEMEAGQLPAGAVVGRNWLGKTGYSICPTDRETYAFTLYALPESLSPRKGFDPKAFRKQAQDVSGNAGLMVVSYARG